MRVTGRFTVQADRAKVWDSIFGSETVAAWVPGARRVAWTAEDRLDATIAQSLMGFTVILDTSLEVIARDSPRRLVLRGRGEDSVTQSRVQFELRVALSPGPDGGTLVEYENDATLSGKLATVGDMLVRARHREIHRQLVDSLRQSLEH